MIWPCGGIWKRDGFISVTSLFTLVTPVRCHATSDALRLLLIPVSGDTALALSAITMEVKFRGTAERCHGVITK